MQDKIDANVVLTEPMSKSAIARCFAIHRSRVTVLLDTIPGTVPVGSLFRLPLVSMPPRYLRDLRLLAPLAISGDSCRAG